MTSGIFPILTPLEAEEDNVTLETTGGEEQGKPSHSVPALVPWLWSKSWEADIYGREWDGEHILSYFPLWT